MPFSVHFPISQLFMVIFKNVLETMFCFVFSLFCVIIVESMQITMVTIKIHILEWKQLSFNGIWVVLKRKSIEFAHTF